MNTTSLRTCLFTALLCLSAASRLAARSPFEAVATTNDGSGISISAGSSNLSDFVTSIVKTTGQFQTLSNHSYVASSTFLGVANAITFNRNAAGTSATFGLAPIGFTKTFTGADSTDVNRQINDFFKKNGADTYAAFLKAIAAQSPVAVTDGNPSSATAMAASSTFFGQGFTSSDEIADAADGTKARFGGFGIGFNAGSFKAAGFKGQNYDFSVTGINIGIGERTRLLTPVSLSYLKLEDAKVGGFGIGLAAPVSLRVMDATNAFNWRLTPSGSLSLRGSEDLASGALLWQAGLTNTIDYKVSPKLVLCLVNQASFHKSIKVSYGDYDFDPKVDQQVLKNGVRAVAPLSRRWVADFFVVETNFLKAAAVKNFTTCGGSLSLRASQSYNLSLGANYDTGSQFKAWSVGLSSAWRW